MLRIHLFGQPRFLADGQPFRLAAPPKTLPLWAYLLLHASQPIGRDTLAFALWPDESEANARANLRRHLHHLQRALPAAPPRHPWLLSDAKTVRWNPAADYWLDVSQFEQAGSTVDDLASAVALYTADLLENVYEDWLFAERERLRNLYVAHLDRLISESWTHRDHRRAIAYCQQLLAKDPLREDVAQRLIALRYEPGDRAGAVLEYRRFVRRLQEELAALPMPETTALYEAVVRGQQIPGVQPARETAAANEEEKRSAPLPFVGREAEPEQLRACWTRAARGRGGVVLVGGEAGIGKSRLAAELALVVRAEAARVLAGTARPAEPMPYHALVEALRSALPLLAALDLDPLWFAAAGPLLPELRARAGKPVALPPLDPEREQARLFEALARVLEGLAQPRPLLVILEDLHWGGAAMVTLLEVLARRAPRHPLLVLVTYREEETGRAHPLRDLRRRLQRENLITHLALERLPVSAVERMVERAPGLSTRAGSERMPLPELARRLHSASEGNPLFLNELVHELLESGAAALPELGPRPSSLSGGLRATVADRLARLSPTARALAEVAAVAGTAFDVELAREVSGWEEDRVLDALGELHDHHLVREVGGGSRFDYAFTHHLIQAAVYAGIPAPARRRRHRRVARVMEELYSQRLDDLTAELALHFDRGGDPDRAAHYSLRAARHALALHAGEEALAHLSRCLELTSAPRPRCDALLLRERVHSRRGDREAQRADLAELGGLARSLGDGDLLCELLHRQVLFHRALGERQAEAALIEALHAAAAERPRWQVEALQAEAVHQLLLNRYDAAWVALQRVLGLRQARDDAGGQAECCCLLADVAVQQGRFEEAEDLIRTALAFRGWQMNQSLMVQTLGSAVGALFAQQRFDSAGALGQQMLDLCRTIGDREGEAGAHASLGMVAARLFRIQEARQHYERAASLYHALGKRQGEAAVLVNAGMLAGGLGQYTESVDSFHKAEELFRSLDDLRGQAACALNAGMAAFFQGDHPAAEAAARRGLELARAIRNPVLEGTALGNLGAAERELGRLAQAVEHMEAGLAIRRRLDRPADLGADLCDLTVAYLRAGNLAKARACADELLDLLGCTADAMIHPQYILWAGAQTYRALGEGRRAHELFDEAHATLQAKAAAIPDAESRVTFLRLPFNAELVAARESGGWR